ncbi:hypothetical protein PR048_018538 [Dryococelus australis]|uniref:YqaJ viral recombinase domain-containing protein n=1 Tax=Dryococelus australis TaxID=614101 RepID=A0ABQ9HCP4_9NEOP|nr:hypothetical protein PR048_018538 [Dryococelus australis]
MDFGSVRLYIHIAAPFQGQCLGPRRQQKGKPFPVKFKAPPELVNWDAESTTRPSRRLQNYVKVLLETGPGGRDVTKWRSRAPVIYVECSSVRSGVKNFPPRWSLLAAECFSYLSPGVGVTSFRRAAVMQWSDYSSPAWANRARFPAGSIHDFRTWELCRTKPLVGNLPFPSPPCIPALLHFHLTPPSTLAQSSPSTVTADNQCAAGIGVFVRTTVESSLQVIELANFSVQFGRARRRNILAVKPQQAFRKVGRNLEWIVAKYGTNGSKYRDLKRGWLAASPDSLVGVDGIVEVECPYRASDLTPSQAAKITKNPSFYCNLENEGNLKLKNNHYYYYQVQGQLATADRTFRDFVVLTPCGMSVERIERDENFSRLMFEKLGSFYDNFLAPEILDSRKQRNMPIITTSPC